MFGFMPSYDMWTHHGETIHQKTASVAEDEYDRMDEIFDAIRSELSVGEGKLTRERTQATETEGSRVPDNFCGRKSRAGLKKTTTEESKLAAKSKNPNQHH
jgi:hypothetical protein